MSALLTRSIRSRSLLPRSLAVNTAGLGGIPHLDDPRLRSATDSIVQAVVESSRKVSAVETKAQRSKRLKRERDARYRANKRQAERICTTRLNVRRNEPDDVFAGRTTMTGRDVSEPQVQNVTLRTFVGHSNGDTTIIREVPKHWDPFQ